MDWFLTDSTRFDFIQEWWLPLVGSIATNALIRSKYRTIYKSPITNDHEDDPNLIERSKQTYNVEVPPLLVEDEQLAKLPLTYILSVDYDHLFDEVSIL